MGQVSLVVTMSVTLCVECVEGNKCCITSLQRWCNKLWQANPTDKYASQQSSEPNITTWWFYPLLSMFTPNVFTSDVSESKSAMFSKTSIHPVNIY